MGDPVETGILIDYDEGQIYIDTRRKKIISRMTKLGFKPFKIEGGYHRYQVSDQELTVSLRKKPPKGATKGRFQKNKPVSEDEVGQDTQEAKEGGK